MARLFLLLLAFLMGACSNAPKETIRVGIDPTWYPLNFGEQTPYVNGFVDDLLQEIAREMRIEFVKVPLISQHDVAVSSLPPYSFNQAKFDFSQNIIRTGPVLIFPINAKAKKLKEMDGYAIGAVEGFETTAILQKYPNILVRRYPNPKQLLDAVIEQDIQGAFLDRIEAVGFTTGIYNGLLKIASMPLNDEGLHLIARKGGHEKFIHSFDKKISELKKKQFYIDLLEKWKL